jgi:hypothetical protein
MQEYAAAGHLGLTGIVTPQTVGQFFQGSERLDLDEVSRHRKTVPTRTHALSTLDPTELANLSCAVELVNAAIATGQLAPRVHAPLDHRLEIVDFPGQSVLGQHSKGEVPGRNLIRLARAILTDFPKTLEVLVHETAHDAGSDGEAAHQRAEGALYSLITLHALQGRHRPPAHLAHPVLPSFDS